MLRFKEKNQEIYKICKDFSKLIEKKNDKRFYTRSSIICINNPATRRESGKWLCKIVTFYRIICPRRSHNAGGRISRASRVGQRKRTHGRGNICRTGRRMRFTFSRVAYFQGLFTNSFPDARLSRGQDDVRAIFSKMKRVKSREIDFTFERPFVKGIWLRHRK